MISTLKQCFMAASDHFGLTSCSVLLLYHVVGNLRGMQDLLFIVLLICMLTGPPAYAVTQDKEQVKYETWQCKTCCSASRLSAACLRKLSSAGRSSQVLCCFFSFRGISWVFLQYEGRSGYGNLTLNVKLYFQGTKQKQRHFIQQVVFCHSKAAAYLSQI